MQNYSVVLESKPSNTFRCKMAADSVSLNLDDKLKHELSIDVDIESPGNIGIIVGASGSGKSTLAQKIFGNDCFDFKIDENKPIIDQFNPEYSYDDCARALMGIGLTQVPCWVRPVKTLSTGQKARAIAALQMMNEKKKIFVMDEFTSTVDRTVAKVMAHCIQKFARKMQKQIVLCSCHYDILEWLNPCWIIDCAAQSYTDRRLLWRQYQRKEKIEIQIRQCSRESWNFFKKYHYLSSSLPRGRTYEFGGFIGKTQIAFIQFANIYPWRNKKVPMIMHLTRIVIHPDFCGLGMGMPIANNVAGFVKSKGKDVMIKFSNTAMKESMQKSKLWKLADIQRTSPDMGRSFQGGAMKVGLRKFVKTYIYRFIPNRKDFA